MRETATVSGPGIEREPPCVGSAIIVAQRAAEQADAPATFYVRHGGKPVCAVERDGRGTVWTTPRGAA